MSLNVLLGCLADGDWHSGEELAAMLGVSRAAVWKQLKALNGYDVVLEANRGQGYRLASGFTPLISQSLANASPSLAAASVDWQLESTNDAVLGLLNQANAERPFVAAFAEHQTAGRGRRGKAWQAPLGGSILMSLLWRLDAMPNNPASAALVAGLAVAESLAELLQGRGMEAQIGLKWPNDVYVNNRKLAGVLCEMHGDPSSDCQLIVGVGVNFSLGGVAKEIDQASIDCAALGLAHSDRPLLAGELLSRLIDYLQQFESQGFERFHKRWSSYDWLVEKPVRVMLRGESREGTAKAVAEDGALLVDHDGELHRHVAGEVSVRRA